VRHRVALLLIIITGLEHRIAIPLSAFAPKTEQHWYAIPAYYDLFRIQEDADNWADRLCTQLREKENVQPCKGMYKPFGDLQQSVIQSNDLQMEIIRLTPKPDVGRNIKLGVSVWSAQHRIPLEDIPCGNTTAEKCAEKFRADIAGDVAGHDRHCHKGNVCANH
jgi:hypothetical protein